MVVVVILLWLLHKVVLCCRIGIVVEAVVVVHVEVVNEEGAHGLHFEDVFHDVHVMEVVAESIDAISHPSGDLRLLELLAQLVITFKG